MSDGHQGGTAPLAAVTGAGGYVGRIVSTALAADGFGVIRLVRRPEAGSSDRLYDLRRDPDASLLAGVDTLIHCAYDFGVTSQADIWAVNVAGTRRLLEAAAASGVRRTILVSSMSAYPGTDQLYGRAKLDAERTALDLGMAVVRLGLVYGPGWGGMSGSLKKMASLPLVPVVGASSYQYTVHEEDLADAFVVLAHAAELPKIPLGLANPEPVNFRELMAGIAVAAGRPHPHLIRIPWRPLYAALRLGERTPVNLPFRADSLLGLVRPAPGVGGAEEVRGLGIRFRSFAPGGAAGVGALGRAAGYDAPRPAPAAGPPQPQLSGQVPEPGERDTRGHRTRAGETVHVPSEGLTHLGREMPRHHSLDEVEFRAKVRRVSHVGKRLDLTLIDEIAASPEIVPGRPGGRYEVTDDGQRLVDDVKSRERKPVTHVHIVMVI